MNRTTIHNPDVIKTLIIHYLWYLCVVFHFEDNAVSGDVMSDRYGSRKALETF